MRGTKGSQLENKETAAQTETAAGEGLELVREQKEVSRKTKETAAQNKTAASEGLELVRGTKGSQSEDKGNRGAKQNSRWRRPGTSARNKR